MAGPLIEIITSTDSKIRNRSLDSVCHAASVAQLVAACAELDDFRRHSDNLYERVRALFFLYAIHRFHLPFKPGVSQRSLIPFEGFKHLLHRRFAEAIDDFLLVQKAEGPSDPSPARWRRRINGSRFKRWPTRSGAACAPSAAINGCFAWGIRPIIRCVSGLNCCGATPRAAGRSCASARRCAWI